MAVNYLRRGESEPAAATVEWVPIRAAGRIDPNELEQAALRSDLRDLPSASYRVSPRTVELVALVLAVLFAVGAAILILRLLPLDRLATRLGARFVDKRSPLEQALGARARVVGIRLAGGGTPRARAACVELRRARNPALAGDASRLAWSQPASAPASTRCRTRWSA